MNGAISREGPAGLPLRCHVVLPGLPAGGNVAVCERGASGVRMTSIDLGGFSTARRLVRALNDTLGHAVGDEVIKQVGKRLHELASGQAIVSRLSSDEFVLLIKDKITADNALKVAQRVAIV